MEVKILVCCLVMLGTANVINAAITAPYLLVSDGKAVKKFAADLTGAGEAFLDTSTACASADVSSLTFDSTNKIVYIAAGTCAKILKADVSASSASVSDFYTPPSGDGVTQINSLAFYNAGPEVYFSYKDGSMIGIKKIALTASATATSVGTITPTSTETIMLAIDNSASPVLYHALTNGIDIFKSTDMGNIAAAKDNTLSLAAGDSIGALAVGTDNKLYFTVDTSGNVEIHVTDGSIAPTSYLASAANAVNGFTSSSTKLYWTRNGEIKSGGLGTIGTEGTGTLANAHAIAFVESDSTSGSGSGAGQVTFAASLMIISVIMAVFTF